MDRESTANQQAVKGKISKNQVGLEEYTRKCSNCIIIQTYLLNGKNLIFWCLIITIEL
jgi:hypothetical protein